VANPWFRLYSEFANDPKVQILTEALQRRYVMLLCMQCNDHLKNRPDDEIALSLRITAEDWSATKAELLKRNLLLKDGSINGWEKRQYISDIKDPTAADRQKRYRDNKRNSRNDTVTSRSPEQNRTDTEHKKTMSEYSDEFDQFWKAYPKKKGKDKAYESWKKKKPSLQAVLSALGWQIQTVDWTKEDGQFIPMPATYLNAGRWKDSPAGEAGGVDSFMRRVGAV